jgi:ribosomal protein S18 acetylase RimI-like enzyme
MTDTSFRLATQDEAEAVVDILRSGFSHDELDVTVLGCSGIVLYVRRQIKTAAIGGDSRYWLAIDDADRLLGCLQLRVLNHSLFLNYICIMSGSRSSGLGSRLLLHALERERTRQSTLLLDVREGNDKAWSWYERLGSQSVSSSEYWEVALPQVEPNRESSLTDFPQALACQQAYGFSEFTVETPDGRHAVGLLGERWFRLTDFRMLSDSGLLGALRQIDPSRSVLAVVPEGSLPCRLTRSSRLIQRTTRMSLELDSVLSRLKLT